MPPQYRIIDTDKEPLSFPPYACAVTGRAFGEVMDFGASLPGIDPRLYLLRSVVEDAARELGMVPEAEVEKLKAELQAHGEKVDELRKLVEATGVLEKAMA